MKLGQACCLNIPSYYSVRFFRMAQPAPYGAGVISYPPAVFLRAKAFASHLHLVSFLGILFLVLSSFWASCLPVHEMLSVFVVFLLRK